MPINMTTVKSFKLMDTKFRGLIGMFLDCYYELVDFKIKQEPVGTG